MLQVVSTIPTLDDLAHEINVRLQKVDDHRLSATLKLAEAKVACKAAGISFKEWVSAKIKFVGYAEATRLAKIGASPDPAKALEDMRLKVRKAVKNHASKKSDLAKSLPAPPARGKAAICLRVREAILALAGLPEPSAVVSYLAGTTDGLLIGEQLTVAAEWLAEFSELWPKEDGNVDAA